MKEDTESITISNAEPIDTLGASALVESDNFYSIPTPSTETDNALTEYTFVKEVRVEAPKNIQQEDDDNETILNSNILLPATGTTTIHLSTKTCSSSYRVRHYHWKTTYDSTSTYRNKF